MLYYNYYILAKAEVNRRQEFIITFVVSSIKPSSVDTSKCGLLARLSTRCFSHYWTTRTLELLLSLTSTFFSASPCRSGSHQSEATVEVGGECDCSFPESIFKAPTTPHVSGIQRRHFYYSADST